MQLCCCCMCQKSKEVKREKIFDDVVNSWKVPEGLSNEEAWNKLQGRLKQEEEAVVRPIGRRWMPAAIAAACVVMAAFFFTGDDEVLTQSGLAIEEVVLPDGSTVILNKGSELSFSQENWNDERTVTLKGEGFFQVEKGSRFSVVTDRGVVSVLGTSFNVYQRSGEMEVDCYTGKVQVAGESNKVILTPGLHTRLTGNELTQPQSFLGEAPDWKEGVFRFDHLSVERVFEEIGNEFDVQIEYRGEAEKYFTGSFEIDTLDQALETVCLSMELEFRREGDLIIVG